MTDKTAQGAPIAKVSPVPLQPGRNAIYFQSGNWMICHPSHAGRATHHYVSRVTLLPILMSIFTRRLHRSDSPIDGALFLAGVFRLRRSSSGSHGITLAALFVKLYHRPAVAARQLIAQH